MIFLILVLAAFLRFFRIEPNLVFHGELGDNYLVIKDFIEGGQIPLLGPATSHPWLTFGPLFYWIMAPILAIFRYSPLAGAIFIAVTQIALVYVNFHYISKLFRKKIALISSFLIAVSPLFLNLTRQSRFFSLVTLFFYPFFYYLVVGRLFLSGIFFGVMLNFHLTPIIFIPPAAAYLIRKRTKLKGYLNFIVGLIIPSLPFLIYNAFHKFEMLKNLALWIPYRVAGFVGIVPKNSPTNVTILNNVYSLSGFISSSFAYRPIFGTIFVVLIIIFVVYVIKINWKVKKITHEFLLVLFFLFGYAGIFIHGNPPIHYYLPLFSLPIIFFSIVLGKIKSRKIIAVILIVIALINFNYFFSKSWFFQDTTKIYPNNEVPYPLQLKVSKSITSDANGQKFSLKRVGDYDYFEKNYAQNYIYLLWLNGNEPINESKLVYTIHENFIGTVMSEEKIFDKGYVVVTKTENK